MFNPCLLYTSKSHYSLKDTSKVYLPEELDKSKLHRMYSESNKENPVGLTTFRNIFDSNSLIFHLVTLGKTLAAVVTY